jgi:ABC-type Fe3+-siderophore transport system permease subunit
MSSKYNDNKFSTVVFRAIVAVLGFIIVAFLVSIITNTSDLDNSKITGILAGIFISFLFLGYAFGGNRLMSKFFAFGKKKSK